MVNEEYATSIPEEQPKELDRKRTIVAKKSGGIELEEQTPETEQLQQQQKPKKKKNLRVRFKD